jgi:putative monooxygenase
MEGNTMKPRLMSLDDGAEELWIGLDTPGMTRKVYRFVSEQNTGATQLNAGVTIFPPGEDSSYHIHPDSEEVNFVLSGSGSFVTEEEERPFVAGDVMFIPKGHWHQHRNTGAVPLVIAWAYAPQAELPST